MFGRMYNRTAAKTGFWVLFTGFNLLYFPMFIMGWLGMPRRYYDYLPEFHIYHLISTVGSWILITGLTILFTNLIHALRKGEKVTERNYWNGETLEWITPTPPYVFNFDKEPVVEAGPYEYKRNDVLEPALEEEKA